MKKFLSAILPVAIVYGLASAADTYVEVKNATNLATQVSGVLPVANGGTNASSASGARTSLSAAASGANSDITSLSGLTTPLSVAQGGTGQAAAYAVEVVIGSAAIDCNSDTDQVVATCPTGKSCILTRIDIAASSATLSTCTAGFGWAAGGTDVTSAQALSAVTSTTSSSVPIFTGKKIGTSGQTLKFNPGTTQSATATAYVFGIIY